MYMYFIQGSSQVYLMPLYCLVLSNISGFSPGLFMCTCIDVHYLFTCIYMSSFFFFFFLQTVVFYVCVYMYIRIYMIIHVHLYIIHTCIYVYTCTTYIHVHYLFYIIYHVTCVTCLHSRHPFQYGENSMLSAKNCGSGLTTPICS